MAFADFFKEEPTFMDQVSYIYENYGWHLFISAILFAFIWYKFIGPKVEQMLEVYRNKKFEREYSAKYHKNPDLFSERVKAQQDWAERMQQKYNKESQTHQQKQKEKEKKKLEEFLNKQGLDKGNRLGGNDNNTGKNTLKDDYNPLMGGGSGSSYRPPRRSACGGGGCGR